MLISATDLTKRYRGGVRALDGVSLRVDRGLTGLLGPNGAGKTTLMRVLCGIVRPSSGTAALGGHDVTRAAGRASAHRLLGYLPQALDPHPHLSGREFLDYVGILKGLDDRDARRRQADDLLERVGLADVADRRCGGYSGGMRRRLGIAQALLGDPRVVIVDEPTSGLDPEERMRFRSLLVELAADRAVILSTHIIEDVAQTCPDVVVLAGGRVRFDGPTDELVEAAAGRTWAVEAAPRAPHPTGTVHVNVDATGTHLRVVADTPPTGAVAVVPTLEDGYVALMREASGAAVGR